MSEQSEPEDIRQLLERKPGGLYLQSFGKYPGIVADSPERPNAMLDLVEIGIQLGQDEQAAVIEQSYLTARDIARSYERRYDALRKRLERFRRDSPAGWKTSEDRTTRSEKYLYLVSAVRDIIQSTPRV
jgi:hypothetical protein